jgi:MoaA/NifB/PqqE/SkfB family radical SAM enzyme
MSRQAYSSLKAAWHLDSIREMRRGYQIVPKQVHFIISDLCNHDCHFCSYRMSSGISSEQFWEGDNHNPNRMIPKAKCFEILDDLADLGVKAVQFTGGGEPTVHPDHLAIFSHAQKLGLQTSLVTNGCLLRDGWREVLPKMAWIRVSIDAGTAETYARVRGVKKSMFQRALGNLQEIVGACPEALVGAGYVVTRENHDELIQGCKKIRDTGAPYVRLAAMFSTDGAGYYDEIYETIKRRIEVARKVVQSDDFKVVDLFGDRISDLEQGAPDYSFCGYQQFCTYIGGNMKVYRCCSTAYTRLGEVGDLSGQRFAEWFHSQQKRRKYADFDAKACQVCQFNDKNQTINYMRERPLHVDFV